MRDPIAVMMQKRAAGIPCGVPSFCTANALVIEAILEQARRFDDAVLIEATSNQVNQFGGYTGMRPADFRDFVWGIADKVGFPRENIMLGGDHLGPLIWASEPESTAMEKAKELVRMFVLAGYRKIHLDTSMRLASDQVNQRLTDETIARRGAELCQACEDAYRELLEENPAAPHPVYIIGSEVPIPGGSQEPEDAVRVTEVSAVEHTVAAYRAEFTRLGLSDAFGHIVALVVQPGVEFGDGEIHHFHASHAEALCEAIGKYDHLVMEGHSTDYQSPRELREMVESGVAILKVGPALTFALREALFALSMIEKELIPAAQRANFAEVLEEAMQRDPDNWKRHYHGSEDVLRQKRKYSLSDRCRYYLSQPMVQTAIEKLFANLDEVQIPLGMLHQYMPFQYPKVRDGKLPCTAAALAKDNVVSMVEDYNYAVKYNYFTAGSLLH